MISQISHRLPQRLLGTANRVVINSANRDIGLPQHPLVSRGLISRGRHAVDQRTWPPQGMDGCAS
jgi:hypothetical protein